MIQSYEALGDLVEEIGQCVVRITYFVADLNDEGQCIECKPGR